MIRVFCQSYLLVIYFLRVVFNFISINNADLALLRKIRLGERKPQDNIKRRERYATTRTVDTTGGNREKWEGTQLPGKWKPHGDTGEKERYASTRTVETTRRLQENGTICLY